MIEVKRDRMVRIEGADFHTGSDRFYPEEAPVRDVRVDGFWINPHSDTKVEFSKFARETLDVVFVDREQ